MTMNWNYLLTSFDGRISRQPFWIAFASVLAAEIIVNMLAARLFGERATPIVDLLFIYPEFAIAAKRAHDRNIPTALVGSFFALGAFIGLLVIVGVGGPIEQPTPAFLVLIVVWLAFGIALLADLGFRRGTPGANRFGPDPLAVRSDDREG
jgi:uncharacterized membrane protein YhaH (DUF805 family)